MRDHVPRADGQICRRPRLGARSVAPTCGFHLRAAKRLRRKDFCPPRAGHGRSRTRARAGPAQPAGGAHRRPRLPRPVPVGRASAAADCRPPRARLPSSLICQTSRVRLDLAGSLQAGWERAQFGWHSWRADGLTEVVRGAAEKENQMRRAAGRAYHDGLTTGERPPGSAARGAHRDEKEFTAAFGWRCGGERGLVRCGCFSSSSSAKWEVAGRRMLSANLAGCMMNTASWWQRRVAQDGAAGSWSRKTGTSDDHAAAAADWLGRDHARLASSATTSISSTSSRIGAGGRGRRDRHAQQQAWLTTCRACHWA